MTFLDEGCSEYFARKLHANAHSHQMIKYEIVLANVGCQLDTSGKRETCLYQTDLEVCLWGIFLMAN